MNRIAARSVELTLGDTNQDERTGASVMTGIGILIALRANLESGACE